MTEMIAAEQLVKLNIDESTAKLLAQRINQYIKTSPSAPTCWERISKEILRPDYPFELHWFLSNKIYSACDLSQCPPPAWIPSTELIANTNIAKQMEEIGQKS